MHRHRVLRTVWVGVALLAAAGTGTAQLAPFPNPSTSPTFSFGVLGLASGETVRINVVNVVRTPPAVAIPQTPCKIELDFYDGQGKLLKQKVIDNLGLGQAHLLDIERAAIAATGRAQVAAVIKVGTNQSIFCSIIPTVEVFDDVTGRASTVLTSPSPGMTPSLRLMMGQTQSQ